MLSIRCFCGVGLFCRTKCSPALSATFRKRIGLNDVARFVFSGGKNKNPRPAARNSLRVLLLMRFTRHSFNDLAIPETKASIFQAHILQMKPDGKALSPAGCMPRRG